MVIQIGNILACSSVELDQRREGVPLELPHRLLNLSVVKCPILLFEFDRWYLINLIYEISGGQIKERFLGCTKAYFV